MIGDRFGTHRVLEPRGGLPQAAWKLDADASKHFDNEIVLDVERLNIDSASFVQMANAGDVAEQIRKTVAERGKQHNPVTCSGASRASAPSWRRSSPSASASPRWCR